MNSEHSELSLAITNAAYTRIIRNRYPNIARLLKTIAVYPNISYYSRMQYVEDIVEIATNPRLVEITGFHDTDKFEQAFAWNRTRQGNLYWNHLAFSLIDARTHTYICF